MTKLTVNPAPAETPDPEPPPVTELEAVVAEAEQILDRSR